MRAAPAGPARCFVTLDKFSCVCVCVCVCVQVNAIYAKYFTEQPPARATFAVKDLPAGARVEIDCVAVL